MGVDKNLVEADMGVMDKLMNCLSLLLLVAFLLGIFLLGRYSVTEMHEYTRDTVFVSAPVAISSKVTEMETVKAPIVPALAWGHEAAKDDVVTVIVHDSIHDSVEVHIPIETKIYEDSTYSAQVSGYHPSLDWIRIYRTAPLQKKRMSFEVAAMGEYEFVHKSPMAGLKVTLDLNKVRIFGTAKAGYFIGDKKPDAQVMAGLEIPIYRK